eukprot:scaffold471283_cov22-Prasinocladus_malaysianus.AAC.1
MSLNLADKAEIYLQQFREVMPEVSIAWHVNAQAHRHCNISMSGTCRSGCAIVALTMFTETLSKHLVSGQGCHGARASV